MYLKCFFQSPQILLKMVKVWKAWFKEKYLNFKAWSCLSWHFAAKTFRRCNRHCSMLQHNWQIGCLRVNVLFVCGDFFAKFLQLIWKQCTVFSCSLDFWQWRLNWVDNRICAEGMWGLDWHVNTSMGSDYTEKQYVTIHPIVVCDSIDILNFFSYPNIFWRKLCRKKCV